MKLSLVVISLLILVGFVFIADNIIAQGVAYGPYLTIPGGDVVLVSDMSTQPASYVDKCSYYYYSTKKSDGVYTGYKPVTNQKSCEETFSPFTIMGARTQYKDAPIAGADKCEWCTNWCVTKGKCTSNNLSVNDKDKDGYNSTASGGNDCDDSNPGAHPGADELCKDGIDNDCDGLIDYMDECLPIAKLVSNGICQVGNCQVCITPETCYHKVQGGENLRTATLITFDIIGEGEGYIEVIGGEQIYCDLNGKRLFYQYTRNVYNQKVSMVVNKSFFLPANNILICALRGTGGNEYASFKLLEFSYSYPNNDNDEDGYIFVGDGGDDCDDTNSNIHPGIKEVCGNNVDDNCDGVIDNDDPICGGCPVNTTLCPNGLCTNTTCSPAADCDHNNQCDSGENCFCDDCWLKQDSCSSGLMCNPNTNFCYAGFCGDGVCSIGESCECSDCSGKTSVCFGGAVCDPVSKTCVCPIGTTLCGDGNCKSSCNNQNTICLLNGVCDFGESCTCSDCHYKTDSCSSGSVCDSKLNLCKCNDGTTLCSDGVCKVNCTSYNCDSNGVCDSGEGCQCADCNNQQSTCMDGSLCKLQGSNCAYSPNLNVCTPSLDVCNGIDDNCNGQTDEDCRPTVRDIYVNTTNIAPNNWIRIYCDVSTGLPESTTLASIYFGTSSNNWIINNVEMWWDPVRKDHYYDYFIDIISNLTSVYYLRCDTFDVYGNSATLTRTTGFTISAYCGDGYCSSTESCSTCSVDCGSCSTGDQGSTGDSGGSSGGSRRSYTVDFNTQDVYSYDNLKENDRFIMSFPGKNKKYVLEIQDEFSSETEFDLDDASNFRISKNSNKNLDVDSDGKNDVEVEVGDISNYRPDVVLTYLRPAGVVCGDGKCDISESCLVCSKDCGTCKTQASCADGIQNQGEEGVDCGGPCLRDCASCYDDIQNQGEEGVDCGGPCSSCAYCGDGNCDDDEDSCSCKDDCEKDRLASWITPFLILIILAGILGFTAKKSRDRLKGIMEDLRKKGEWDKPTNSSIRGEIIYKLRFWSRMFYVVLGLVILAGIVLVYYLGICNDCKSGWILSIILLIIIALLSLVYGLYKKYGNPKRRTITLADAEKIIRNAIKKGYKPDQIKRLAIDQGWTVDTINRILDKIKSEDGNKK